MVVLVTGGRGFLGRHTLAALSGEGVDGISAGRPDIEVPSDAFDRLLRSRSPSVVVHCAGPSSVQASVARPADDYAGSIGTTQRLVEALSRLAETPKLVLVSSAAVYGNPTRLPIAEDHPTAPISPYGQHRLEVERLVRSSGLPHVVARVFSAYGEGLRRQVLWDVAMKGRSGAVELWGTGNESRDFIQVEDVGRALVRLCMMEWHAGEVVNVASGQETTIAELAQRLLDALDLSAPLSFVGVEREGDPLRWQADVSRLRSSGWRQEIALDAGIARYARWLASDVQ